MPANLSKLTPAASKNVSPSASPQIADKSQPHSKKGDFTTFSYEGLNGGVPTSGTFYGVSANRWVEVTGIGVIFFFEELKENSNKVVLYDAGRDVTVTANLASDKMTVEFGSTRLNWTITEFSKSDTAPSPGANVVRATEGPDVFVFNPWDLDQDGQVTTIMNFDPLEDTIRFDDVTQFGWADNDPSNTLLFYGAITSSGFDSGYVRILGISQQELFTDYNTITVNRRNGDVDVY